MSSQEPSPRGDQIPAIKTVRSKVFNVEGDFIVQSLQAAANYRPDHRHQLPSLNERFIGRKQELAKVCADIRQGANAGRPTAVTSTIEGQGGVGKTELAVAAGYALLQDFPDAQFVLRLGSHSAQPATPSMVRDSLLRVLDPASKLPEDEAALWELYRQSFRKSDSGTCTALLILDDVADDQQVRVLQPPPGCAVIVTSRSKLDSGKPLLLKKLLEEDAVNLLREYRQDLADDEAKTVAGLCGHLPVTLNVAGSLLRRNPTKPVAEYIVELRADRLARLRDPDETRDINVIFGRSLRNLNDGQQVAFAALSVMAGDFDRASGCAVGACRGEDLDEIESLHLLEYDEKANRFDWHDLARGFAVQRIEPENDQHARFRHAIRFCETGREAENLYLKGGESMLSGLRIFDRERVHFEAAFEFLEQFIITGEIFEQGVRDSAAKLLAALVDATVHTSDLRFPPEQRIRWLVGQQKACSLIKDLGGEGAALGNLGAAYSDLGEIQKAVELHRRALAIAQNVGDRRGESNAFGALGTAHCDLGEPQIAVVFYEQALVASRGIMDRRAEGSSLGNLGGAYLDMGEHRRALNYFEQSFAIARESGDWRGIGTSLGNLGIAYSALGEKRRAITLLEQALAIRRQIGDRRGEGTDLGNLGSTHLDLKESLKAINYFEQSLAVACEIGDRRGQGNILGNLGNAYFILGEIPKATELHERSLAIHHQIGDHRSEGIMLFNSALASHQITPLSDTIARAEASLSLLGTIGDPIAAKVRDKLAEWRKAK